MNKGIKILLYSMLCIIIVLLIVFLWKKLRKSEKVVDAKQYPVMTYIGHASVKIISTEGNVIYIDPYFPGDYETDPADYILVTHGHDDHNQVSLCKQAEGCKVIKWTDALVDGAYQTFDYGNIKIEAVPSGGNVNHNVNSCVGFIVTVDGVSVYHAGDTSMTEDKNEIAKKHIDYAMYPIDGYYNMGPEEASEVAKLVGATNNIPIHGNGEHYAKQCEDFSANGKLVIGVGQSIVLKGVE